MTKKRALTGKQEQSLLSEFKKGKTRVELAEKFQIHPLTVSKVLIRMGVRRKKREISPGVVEKMQRLHETGMTIAEIARSVQVSVITARKYLIDDETKKALIEKIKGGMSREEAGRTEGLTAKQVQSFLPKKLKQFLSPAEVKKIVNRYEAGEGYVALAKEYDVSPKNIKKVLKKEKCTIRPPGIQPTFPPAEKIKQLIALYEGGSTLHDIAEKERMSVLRLRKILEHGGGVIRARGHRPREESAAPAAPVPAAPAVLN